MTATTLFPIFLSLVHCLETDHVLAVATVSAKETKAKSLFYQEVTWGIGHSIPIILIGTLYIWSKIFILRDMPFSLEVIVGIVLIVAGVFKLTRKPRSEKLNNHIKAILLVGLLHGLAGSSSVILAHTGTQTSVATQVLYFFGFSIGSMTGMGIINLFLGKIEGLLAYIKKIQWLIPVLSIGYGLFMIYKFS
ncbi:HupE/UreJ family protein [Aquimarina sp. RZ0]|uniref:HupE/UreJ family protein n=1 Tax=Aquimarina sp. RZ0 TaxID=2607730 RepID=UPI0011F39816|nr:HupE/UreJ family protein [Aquimarina sp. RZ0]KAA1247501.1 hypothetical protein F0000_03320 [Aquimarina sp. RZ0]